MTVVYCEMMKMHGIPLTVSVPENAGLKEFQRKVFDRFWEVFRSSSDIKPHGHDKIDYVNIATRGGLAIKTDEQFHQAMNSGEKFEVRVVHP